MTSKVFKNGRVTLPKPIRSYLGLEPGMKVDFRRTLDAHVVIERADGIRSPNQIAQLQAIDEVPAAGRRHNRQSDE